MWHNRKGIGWDFALYGFVSWWPRLTSSCFKNISHLVTVSQWFCILVLTNQTSTAFITLPLSSFLVRSRSNLFSANLLFAAIGASGKIVSFIWNQFDLDGNYCKSPNPPCNLFTRQLQHWLRTLCSRSRKLRSAGKTAFGLTDQNPGKNFYNLKVSGCHWQDDDIEEIESFGIKNWSKSKRKTDWKWKSNGKLRFNKSILGLD